MRPNRLTRTLVSAAIALGGTLAAAGHGVAASEPATIPTARSGIGLPTTVVDFGLTSTEAGYIQCRLRDWGYTGPIDGRLDHESWQAFQLYLQTDWGYIGEIDGIVDHSTMVALERMLVLWGGDGVYDGVIGPRFRTAFQKFAHDCRNYCSDADDR